MSTGELAWQVSQQHEVAIIELHGDINASSERALNAAYTQATHDNPDAVELDFADVGYINSPGIALIVSMMAQARKSGRRFLAKGLSPHYQEIFNMTRLSDFMTIV